MGAARQFAACVDGASIKWLSRRVARLREMMRALRGHAAGAHHASRSPSGRSHAPTSSRASARKDHTSRDRASGRPSPAHRRWWLHAVILVAAVVNARLRNRDRSPPDYPPPTPPHDGGEETELSVELDRASSGPALVAVLLAVVPLSFSGDFIEAASEATEQEPPPWTIYAVDGALLLLILAMIVRLRRRSPRLGGARSGVAWWWLGAALMLGTDALDRSRDERPLWFDLATTSLWLLSVAVLLAATLGSSPSALLRRDEPAWIRFRPALPLLAGTSAAFLAGILWARELDPGAVRTVDDALARAEDLRLIKPGASGADAYAVAHQLCAGAID
jgi:MYXO-CTERM domain-containing protein